MYCRLGVGNRSIERKNAAPDSEPRIDRHPRWDFGQPYLSGLRTPALATSFAPQYLRRRSSCMTSGHVGQVDGDRCQKQHRPSRCEETACRRWYRRCLFSWSCMSCRTTPWGKQRACSVDCHFTTRKRVMVAENIWRASGKILAETIKSAPLEDGTGAITVALRSLKDPRCTGLTVCARKMGWAAAGERAVIRRAIYARCARRAATASRTIGLVGAVRRRRRWGWCCAVAKVIMLTKYDVARAGFTLVYCAESLAVRARGGHTVVIGDR
jgi:hypothetical protein